MRWPCIVYEKGKYFNKSKNQPSLNKSLRVCLLINKIFGEENFEKKKQWFHALGIWTVISLLYAAITNYHKYSINLLSFVLYVLSPT